MEDARAGNQITRDDRYSYVDLGHILSSRVLNCHLSSLTLDIHFHSIENGRRLTDVR
jgi:hypothetical protein